MNEAHCGYQFRGPTASRPASRPVSFDPLASVTPAPHNSNITLGRKRVDDASLSRERAEVPDSCPVEFDNDVTQTQRAAPHVRSCVVCRGVRAA